MRLLFVGDVMLGRGVNDTLKRVPPNYPWGDTTPVFSSADLRLCNLECVLSDTGVPWTKLKKSLHFRTDAKNVEALGAAGINVVSLANNHSLDYGPDAMVDMIANLDDAGLYHAGAGRTLEEASRPAVVETENGKVAVIAFTDNEPSWEAADRESGLFYVPTDLNDSRATRLLELVKETRERADMLVVSAHWGANFGYVPEPEHIPFAHALIDHGADIIFGHSSHVFRGVEIYQGRPIFYSAGDFIDDYAIDLTERNDESFIFLVEAEPARIREVRLHPVIIENMQANLSDEVDQTSVIIARMRELCHRLKTKTAWREAEGYLEIVRSAP